MVFEVIKDMDSFLLMISVTILAISEAFYALNNSRIPDERQFSTYF